MSGIAGVIRFGGAPVEPGLIERMTGAMSHRGSDGVGHWVSGPVALGHCMLRTTPESLEESQPLSNEEGSVVLVMDGRVDNWEGLRRALLDRGAALRTRADAELVLRAYEAWGRDCLSRIDGDFALVVWDGRRREAFCARDRTGRKTFTYHWHGDTLAFASELHAILALPWVRAELNEGLLAEVLADEWRSRDETFWKGILRLPAAHQMTATAAGARLAAYWAPDLSETLPYAREEDYAEHYLALITDVVRRTSRSHAPVAYEVSGGLDSSAIFAIAEHLRRKGELPAPGIGGYCLKFDDAPAAEERAYSRAVGAHLGVTIEECDATIEPRSWYQAWARRYRELPGYPNGVMLMGMRRAVRARGARAVLTGAGGDAWLGGTWPGAYYTEDLAGGRWRDVLTSFAADRQEVGLGPAAWTLFRFGAVTLLPEGIKDFLRAIRWPGGRILRVSPRLRQELERRLTRYERSVRPRLRRWTQAMQLEMLAGAFDTMAYEIEERMTASLGIELRHPFFNHKIIQLAFSTPERLRSLGRAQKRLHRRALAGLLPDVVLKRNDKADFMVTFRRSLDPLMGELRRDILPRHVEWISAGDASALCDAYDVPAEAGRCAWWLWSFVGCDALVEAAPAIAASSRPSQPEVILSPQGSPR
jgi:asparagine synthase (glutamine-hydrolysing)